MMVSLLLMSLFIFFCLQCSCSFIDSACNVRAKCQAWNTDEGQPNGEGQSTRLDGAVR